MSLVSYYLTCTLVQIADVIEQIQWMPKYTLMRYYRTGFGDDEKQDHAT